MDPAALIPIVSPLVTAAIAYLRDEAAKKAGEKAAEVIGEKTGEALARTGPQAISLFRSWFRKKADKKGQTALEMVEDDPYDNDYQDKLVKEVSRLAAVDTAFAQDLKILAQQVTVAQTGSVIVSNNAPNEGAQGVFNAPVTFNRNTPADE